MNVRLCVWIQTVHSIEDPEKDSKAMDNWIESIGEIHRQKPPTTVHYTKYRTCLHGSC